MLRTTLHPVALLLPLILVLLLHAVPAHAQVVADARPRIGGGAVVLGRFVYVVGGMAHGGHEDVLAVERLDPRTGAIELVAPLPSGHVAGGVVACAGRIYAVAGGIGDDMHARVHVYDPEANAWSRGPDLPTPRNRTATAAVGDTVFVLGGMTSAATVREVNTDAVHALDTTTGAWSACAPMTAPRHAHAAVAHHGRVIVTGGYESGPVATVEIYDPALDRWTAAPPLGVARGFHASAVVGQRIYVLGGRTVEAPVEVLEPGASAWRSLNAVVEHRHRGACVVVEGSILLIDGEEAGRGAERFVRFEPR